MPDTLSLSTGVSLGLLAGIVSGVCYIVANGLNWPKTEEESRRRRLTFSPDEGVCITCGGDRNGGLVPCICQKYQKPVKFESGAWFLRQVQKAVSLMPWTISTDKLEQIEEECESRESPGPNDPRGELKNVREFLEALSAKLSGGPLEGTRVAPLYHHPAYLPAQSSQSSASRPGATAAHVQLKRLVARVVEEAAALPALARYAAEPTTPNDASTYEDLLATAILNKVIERYQTENGSGGRSSGIHSASASPSPSDRSSPRSVNSRHTRDVTPPLREEDEDVSDWEEGTDEALELPRRVPFPEFGGDVIHHTENTERDFDEVSGSDIQAVDGSWEENWLFQKKKIKTIQSVPVPMLVPNSNTDYRVLIGDRDADDTTDLSDNASDAEEESEYKSDIRRVLDSKHVIGGKTVVDDSLEYEPDSLTIINGDEDFGKGSKRDYVANNILIDATNNEINDNNNENEKDSVIILSIDSGPISKAEFTVKEDIHRSLFNGTPEEYDRNHDKSNGDIFNSINDSNSKSTTNTLSRHEREGEYEEAVTIPVQRYADSLRRKHFEDEPQQIPTRDTDYEEELLPGTVAYRERKKWLNCVEMPNNPYSPEAIQKRLSSQSTSSLFDIITTKTKDFDKDINDKMKSNEDIVDEKLISEKESTTSDKENNNENKKINLDIAMKGGRSKSPSPKNLKDALAEEIPEFKRYGRDYYIKEAKTSSGCRKKNSFSDTCSLTSMSKATSLDNFDTEFTSPGLLIKQFKNIAANQHFNNFSTNDVHDSITTSSTNNKTEIVIEYEDADDQTLFSAQPAYVDDTDQKIEEILKSASNMQPLNIIVDESSDDPEKSPSSVDQSFMSTSSIDDSIKIYNVQTGEILKSKPVDTVSPRYENAVDSNDNTDMADKNIQGKSDDVISYNGDVEEEIVIDSLEEPLQIANMIDEITATLPKVKELAKKFVSMDNLNGTEKPTQYTRRRTSKDNLLSLDKPVNKNAYMHSLTARSISREFREELKLSMATPLKVPGGSKEIPEGIEEVTKESSRPGSPLPEPGTIKTKLAFFESLRSKFSNNSK